MTSPSPTPRRRTRPRRVGRPRASARSADVRTDLLAAARATFATRGYAGVSLREVAKTAGTTAAMVSYYFGDKDGLYAALLQDALADVLARVRAGLAARAAAGAPPGSLHVLFEVAAEALGSVPWIPQLVVREVLSEDAPFRDSFIDEYARPMSQLLRGALRAEIAAGRLRADLDVDLAFASLLGLAAFPFVARPVLERVLGFAYDDAFVARLSAHTQRLFVEGARS
ncbi:MAG: TetR/AcrR family transcriptional regulator [Deltaproteobacteria bacterium]|nr:TetR/AcrR family transcriptional regulator [Deltaproteobacteria bacterium]